MSTIYLYTGAPQDPRVARLGSANAWQWLTLLNRADRNRSVPQKLVSATLEELLVASELAHRNGDRIYLDAYDDLWKFAPEEDQQ